MGTITKSNTFVNNTPADASEVNTNFDEIIAEVNGNLDNDNIDAAAGIEESKLLFATDGHAHGGDTDGKVIDEDDVVFNGSGHDHSGGTDGVDLVAAKNGTKGIVLVESNIGGAAVNIGDAATSVINLSNISQVFSIMVLWDLGGGALTNRGFGNLEFPPDIGYYEIINVGADVFTILNLMGSAKDFYWYAIGI